MSINLISQLKHQWFWWLQMLGGSVTSWSPSPYYFPFLLLPFWVAVTFCWSSPTSTVPPGESYRAEPPLKGTRSPVGWCWGNSLSLGWAGAEWVSPRLPSWSRALLQAVVWGDSWLETVLRQQSQGPVTGGQPWGVPRAAEVHIGSHRLLLLPAAPFKRSPEICSISAARHFPGNVKGHRNMTKTHESYLFRFILAYFFTNISVELLWHILVWLEDDTKRAASTHHMGTEKGQRWPLSIIIKNQKSHLKWRSV